MKKIALLTSGGDAPGMNTVIYAVVRSAIGHGIDVMDVERGYDGLIRDEMHFIEHPEEFDPRKYLAPARDAIKDMVAHKMRDVLRSSGQA